MKFDAAELQRLYEEIHGYETHKLNEAVARIAAAIGIEEGMDEFQKLAHERLQEFLKLFMTVHNKLPAILAHIAEQEKRAVKMWECPDCGFEMNAIHTLEDGSYLCPCCDQAKLQRENDALREFARDVQNTIKDTSDLVTIPLSIYNLKQRAEQLLKDK